MGFWAWQYARKVRGLRKARPVFLEIAGACIDETAFLMWSRARLAAEMEVSVHTLERHLPRLRELNLVLENDLGFRLPEYYKLRQNGGQNGQEKERTKEKENRELKLIGNTPLPPASGGIRFQPRRRRDRERIPPMDRPEISNVHRCIRCEVPHDWSCPGVACLCGSVRIYSCDAVFALKGESK